MKLPTVEFIKLRKPEKAKHFCELAEQFHLAAKRVLITVQDDNQGITLDRYMWTWKRQSFLPHVFDNGTVDCLDEPIVITAEQRNANGARIAILGKPCPLNFLRQFEHIVDFAELYDDALAEASRQRYRLYQEAGIAPRMRE